MIYVCDNCDIKVIIIRIMTVIDGVSKYDMLSNKVI
jgi:hypothetical protein